MAHHTLQARGALWLGGFACILWRHCQFVSRLLAALRRGDHILFHAARLLHGLQESGRAIEQNNQYVLTIELCPHSAFSKSCTRLSSASVTSRHRPLIYSWSSSRTPSPRMARPPRPCSRCNRQIRTTWICTICRASEKTRKCAESKLSEKASC